MSSAFAKLFDDADRLFTSFDPNIRDKMISDGAAYKKLLLEKWVSKFDLVKVSDADLAYLYGTTEEKLDLDAIAAEWLAAGSMPLFLVTRGSLGTVAYRKSGGPSLSVALDPVKVADTVGAGDTNDGGTNDGGTNEAMAVWNRVRSSIRRRGEMRGMARLERGHIPPFFIVK